MEGNSALAVRVADDAVGAGFVWVTAIQRMASSVADFLDRGSSHTELDWSPQ